MANTDLSRYSWGVNEVAKKLGYHPQYVRFITQQGKLPALKRIRKWMFDPQEIEQFLLDKTHEAQSR